MLRYGNFKAGHGKNKHNTRLQRVEELKNMYQNAMKSGGICLYTPHYMQKCSLRSLIDSLVNHFGQTTIVV